MSLQTFVTKLTDELVPLYKESCEGYWEFTTTGKPEAMDRSANADKKMMALWANSERFAEFKQEKTEANGKDPILERIATDLELQFIGGALTPEEIEDSVKREKEIENDFTNFRALVGGEKRSENWLREQLKTSNDATFRKEVWEGAKQIGSVTGPKIRDLIKARNAIARRLGYSDAWTMRIQLQGLDPDNLLALLNDVFEKTKAPWAIFKRNLEKRLAAKYNIKPEELRPWHYEDPFFQEAPVSEYSLDKYFENLDQEKLTKAFYDNIGLSIDSILAGSDLYEREGKQQHAFCMSVDREDDIRILCNVKPTDYWMSTMLHEFGHGVYDKYVDRALPFMLRGPAHTLTTEAIAMLMERHVKNPAWLIHYAGVPEKEAKEAGEIFRKNMVAKHLIMARWCLVMVNFERAMYLNPDADLDTLWWDLVEKFQEIKRPDGRKNSDWAAKIHLGCSPVYYQNYLLGDLMASQLQATIKGVVLAGEADVEQAYITSPKVGTFLREKVFHPGSRWHWQKLVEFATGKPLVVDAFITECNQ
ncbi:MAG: M2 family metallopeptidase [bacterium]|nr:M2 family metallopeptidase [bacterium]